MDKPLLQAQNQSFNKSNAIVPLQDPDPLKILGTKKACTTQNKGVVQANLMVG